MMTQLKPAAKHLFLAILLMLSTNLSAQYLFSETGKITSIDKGQMTISDSDYRISPTVKVYNLKNQPINVNLIKENDYVEVSIIKIGKKLMVDEIFLVKP